MARLVLLLLHAPPEVPFVVSVIVEPAHTVAAPLIVPALPDAFTVTSLGALVDTLQPLILYVIFVVPDATPVTTPVLLFTVAAAGLLLFQVPPEVPLVVIVIVDPAHTDDAPLTVPAVAAAFTVISFGALVAKLQPFTL